MAFTEQEWKDLLLDLRGIARNLFRSVGLDTDWQDAVQHACLIILATPGIRSPLWFGAVVMRRLRNEVRTKSRRERGQADLDGIPVRPGFDDELLAADWIEKALRRIPPAYRATVMDIDVISHQTTRPAVGEARTSAYSQKCWKVRRQMRDALARVAA